MIGNGAVSREFDWKDFFRKYGLLLSTLLLALGLTLASERFLTADNLLNVLRQASINGIISVGMMMVILTKGIDLSVGSVLALSTVVAADLLTQGVVSPTMAVVAAIGIGGLAGVVNGALVTFVRIPPFIATLAMLTFARGAALFYTDGQPVTGLGGLGEGFRYIGTAEVLGIPVPVIVMAIVFILAYILLTHIPLGRYIYALGNNEDAAYLSGLPVRRVKMFVYIVSGMLSALAGVILVGRINSAQPGTLGEMFELDAIAAVVVGGTSFSGGEGTVWGTFIGAFIIAMLENGLNLLEVSAFYQDIAKGAVIAGALLLYRAIR